MQKLLTPDGRTNADSREMRPVIFVISNDTENIKKIVLCRSSARSMKQNVAYNVTILKESETCVVEPNTFFKTLDDMQAFVMACPTRLHTVSLQPISSANLIEQTGSEAVKIKTPTFGEDLIEAITPIPQPGGSVYQLHNFFLGGVAEVEITIQPKTQVKVSLQFGAYMAERLVV